MQKRIECQISGRVQLVMYRDFSTRTARALGLCGTVQNMNDGSVFLVAEGEETILRTFIEKLKKGPILARVEDVRVSWGEPTGEFSDFHIIYK